MSKCLRLRVKLAPRQITGELIDCFHSLFLSIQIDTNKSKKKGESLIDSPFFAMVLMANDF